MKVLKKNFRTEDMLEAGVHISCIEHFSEAAKSGTPLAESTIRDPIAFHVKCPRCGVFWHVPKKCFKK